MFNNISIKLLVIISHIKIFQLLPSVCDHHDFYCSVLLLPNQIPYLYVKNLSLSNPQLRHLLTLIRYQLYAVQYKLFWSQVIVEPCILLFEVQIKYCLLVLILTI